MNTRLASLGQCQILYIIFATILSLVSLSGCILGLNLLCNMGMAIPQYSTPHYSYVLPGANIRLLIII
jgi:hypothetical protein